MCYYCIVSINLFKVDLSRLFDDTFTRLMTQFFRSSWFVLFASFVWFVSLLVFVRTRRALFLCFLSLFLFACFVLVLFLFLFGSCFSRVIVLVVFCSFFYLFLVFYVVLLMLLFCSFFNVFLFIRSIINSFVQCFVNSSAHFPVHSSVILFTPTPLLFRYVFAELLPVG